MNKITEETRKDILDIIKDGFITHTKGKVVISGQGKFDGYYEVRMHFSGRLSEIEFLSRLYDLDNMPSTDTRFNTARDDILKHTVDNNDWERFWFFGDSRFKLSNGNDDKYILNFISEMLHPSVRKEDSKWEKYLTKFNQLLNSVGYVLIETEHITGRTIYVAKELERIEIEYKSKKLYSSLRLIGEGSYAQVFKYKDEIYNKTYSLKRAKKSLDNKELERFKREFQQMKDLKFPNIVEVYFYNEISNEYVMEYMDGTLEKYINERNSTITVQERKGIILQVIRGYQYLHSKGLFHRDVSFKNVLVKKYDGVNIYKISDFGLVKIPDSDLTSQNSELKGCLNDPTIKIKGFDNYDLLDEIYALTLLFVYILTGKTNFGTIRDQNIRGFMEMGTNSDRTIRYQNLEELKEGMLKCIKTMV